ncbi:MAG: hypothetical protein K1X79_13400 [Oligoflexia bacterium]|nr:hypothetical protein [Oligoflexia bacterium]
MTYRPQDPKENPERRAFDVTGGAPHEQFGPEGPSRLGLLSDTLGRAGLELGFRQQVGKETAELMALIAAGRMERFDGHNARFGIEIEMHLADQGSGKPASINARVLDRLTADAANGPDPKAWTCELSKWQIECRTGVALCAGNVLSAYELEIQSRLAAARAVAKEHGAIVVPISHLPSIGEADLSLDGLSDTHDRYHRANDFAHALRHARTIHGENFPVHVPGRNGGAGSSYATDSIITAGTICSLQPHLQVSAERFVDMFNISHAITGFVLAPAASSPLVLGRAGWKEGRISLFEQAWDPTRVFFGTHYIEHPIDPFILNVTADLHPMFVAVQQGGANNAGVPYLPNLVRHNGTIHRWNRPIFGVNEQGEPHLRVEHRALPVAPAPVDNIANAAFFWGLSYGLHVKYGGDISKVFPFEHAKANFYAAAKDGLEAKLYFPEERQQYTMAEKLDWLMGVARLGLETLGVERSDTDKYLGVMEARIRGGVTEADWMLSVLGHSASSDERVPENVLGALTRQIARASALNIPVHERADRFSELAD